MSYEAEISRANPTAFFFTLDQSYSMSEAINGGSSSKAAMLGTVINRLLSELVLRCTKGEEVFNYFEVALIGYGNPSLGSNNVGSALGGHLAGRDVVPVSELADYPIRIEKKTNKVDDGAGGLVDMQIEFPVWIEPAASNNTPMTEAMSYIFNLVSDWVVQHPNSFPPIVINVTDGEPNDGDPRPQAEAIRSLATKDGNVLLFSLHLSKLEVNPVVFPSDSQSLPDDYARLLFEMSSPLPTKWNAMAAETMGIGIKPGARSFVFNADLAAMIKFLEIGTRQPTTIGY